MRIDDLTNPDYRRGRRRPVETRKREPVRRPDPSEAERRARFAIQAARAEFGRFYWNDELRRRTERELENSRRLRREARRRKRIGADR